MSSNASNESPTHPANQLPLSPSAYYDSIPLTTQLPLNVMREILQEATIHHEEEPLPASPCTGLNVLHNSNCTLADMIDITKGLAAMIKNRESFYHLHILLLQEQIVRLRGRDKGHSNNHNQPNDDHPCFIAAPVGFTINAGHLPNATLPTGQNSGQLAKWVQRLPDGRALLYTEDDGPGDQPYAIKLFATLDLS